MIHHTPEATVIKLGLNYKRSKGGFCLLWAWYDFAKHEAFTARLRFRWHIKPRLLWSVERNDVIQNYMDVRGLTMVHREVLEDLNAMESEYIRRSDRTTVIKPI
jgi:hypothetical protein